MKILFFDLRRELAMIVSAGIDKLDRSRIGRLSNRFDTRSAAGHTECSQRASHHAGGFLKMLSFIKTDAVHVVF